MQGIGFIRVAIAGAATALLLVSFPGRAQEQGPFAMLSGNWTGTGTISMNNGARERIRCRVKYDVGQNGNQARQELRCASDSYKFEMTTEAEHKGGFLSGRWSEVVYNVAGIIGGRVIGGIIDALAEGPGYSITVLVNTRGNQQTVQITSLSPHSSVREVSVTASRASR